MLLLRRAVFALRSAAQEVTVLAPAPAAALVGPGKGEAQGTIDWDSAAVSTLFGEHGSVEPRLRARLTRFHAAIAYTRNNVLVANLRRLIPKVVQHDPIPPAGMNASRWYASAVEALGVDPRADEDLPSFQATPEEETAAAEIVRNVPRQFIAVHPGSGSPTKNWPAERFLTLLEKLAAPPWLVVIGPADEQAAAAFRGRNDVVLGEKMTPRVLGSVLSRAGLHIGNDSGATHTAPAWGAPTVVLFGPTDPEVWAPEGAHVRVVRAPDGRMESLEVDDVLRVARSVLAPDDGPKPAIRSAARGRRGG